MIKLRQQTLIINVDIFFKRFVNLFSVMAGGRVHQLVRTFYSFGHIYTYLLEECFKRRNVAIPMLMLALSSHSIL